MIYYETAYSKEFKTKIEAQEDFLRLVEQIAPHMYFVGHNNKWLSFYGKIYESSFFDGAYNFTKVTLRGTEGGYKVELETNVIHIYHKCKVPHWIRVIFDDTKGEHDGH